MKEKIQKIYMKHKSFILYGLFGVPPAVLNFVGYALMVRFAHVDAAIAALIAWVIALLLSFYLYRKYVFRSSTTEFSEVMAELGKFSSVRAGTGLFEIVCVWVFVTMLHLNPYLFKMLTGLSSIVINYIVSKTSIFKENVSQ